MNTHKPEVNNQAAEEVMDEVRIPGLERLPRERLPEGDLWTVIAPRLTPRARRRPWLPMSLAASIVVALTTGVLLRVPPSATPESQSARPAAGIQLAQADVSGYTDGDGNASFATGRLPSLPNTVRWLRYAAPADEFPSAEVADGSQPALMRAAFRRSSATLSAGRREHDQHALLRAHLKIVENAERELSRALRQDPDSESLADLLQSARSQRAALQTMIETELN